MSQTVWNMNGFPKVGIRPIIDGRRRGVRESLEVQTMKMAETAAKLISSSLRYPDGSSVECVIADTTIAACMRLSSARRSSVRIMLEFRSPSRRAGATVRRRWMPIRSCRRPCGGSTARSVLAPYIWPVCSQENQGTHPSRE